MEAQDECWQLARNCANWAKQYDEPDVRNALLRMAKNWARLALQTDVEKDEPKQKDGSA